MRLTLTVLAVLTLTAAGLRADPPAPRVIDFNQLILDFDGNPVTECADPRETVCKEKHIVTLGDVAMRALVTPEANPVAEESFRRGELARRVYKGSSVQLSAEEIVLIKKQVAKAFSPLVVYHVFTTLDPQK
jgi:hypothetical protein